MHGSRVTVFLRVVEFCISTFLAVVWVKSALAHLDNPYYFLSTVYKYELVGPLTGIFIAMVLPYFQLLLAILLLGRLFVSASLILSSLLLFTFSAAQLSVLNRGIAINCGCFGNAIDQMTIDSKSVQFVLALCCLGMLGAALRLVAIRVSKTVGDLPTI